MAGKRFEKRVDRRTILKATGAASAASLAGFAGCLGGDGDGDGGGDGDDDGATGDGDGDGDGDDGDGAGDYPSEDMRYIIPFSEGGGTDTYARQLIPIMGDELGVNIQIENIPGAASLRGTGELYHSEPDGYTFGGFNPPSTPVSAMVNPPDYDLQELEGIGAYARTPFVIVANPDYGVENMEDLISRYQDGELEIFAGKEKGGVDHVLALLMKNNEEYQLDWDRYVGYQGSGPAVQAVVSDEVPVSISTDTAAQGAVEDGRAETVVGLSSEGSEVFPDIQSVTDEGYPNIDFLGQLRRGMYAPPDTSEDHIQVLTEALEAALQTDDMQSWSEETGNVIEYGGPEAANDAVQQAFEQVPENVDLEQVREEAG